MRAHAASVAPYDTHLRHVAPFERIRCVLSYLRPSRLCFSRRSPPISRTSAILPAGCVWLVGFLSRCSFYAVRLPASPRKEVAAMGRVLTAKDAMTISLRALGRRYRRLGAPIFSSAELARRRERQAKRERNQRSTIKAARLVCLAKAFLRPAIDPVARIGAPYPRECSSSCCRCFYYKNVFLRIASWSIESRIAARRSLSRSGE